MSKILEGQLQWYPALGLGYFPVKHQRTAYYDQYSEYDGEPLTEQLNSERVDIVDQYVKGNVTDFGIGSGAFIRARGIDRTKGYDIDHKAVKWLKDNQLFVNPYDKKIKTTQCMTFWDSLEHLRLPQLILSRITQYVFISIPIFQNLEHIQESKHYKTNEHYWYFTLVGLISYMSYCDFNLEAHSDVETKLGREDITTFIFRRK